MRYTVLIIDDNPDDREAFRRALKKANKSFGYLEAGDAASGLVLIEQYRPECVLLDSTLPGLSSLATLRRIHDADPYLPVIMLSGQGSEEIATQAMKAGARNYLVKSAVTPNLLYHAILAATKQASLERRIGEQQRHIQAQKLELVETNWLKTAILASNGAIIIATTDHAGRVLTFNPAAETALGYSAKEVIGKHTPAVWCDEAQIARRASELSIGQGAKMTSGFDVLAHAAQSAGREAREWTFIRKNGSQFTVSLAMTPLRDGEGYVTGYLCMAEDITGRMEVDRIKSEFIAIVAYELRMPLTSIRGSLAPLAGKAVNDVPVAAQTLIDIAHKNCERLILLTSDILDIDKIAAGKMRFSMRPEPAAALMEEAVEATRGYAASLDVTIRLTPPVPGLTLNVDRDRFIQVLNNFLSNAVKASPGHSAIELRAEAHEGRARILVRNAGAGNATKFQDQALNAFSLTDTSSQRKRGAAGAGLHISRQIIEHMGGRIGFDSGAGPGMTMWVEMPAARVEMPASTAEAAVAPQADGAMPAEPGPRVLVCEDDDRVAWLIQKMLTKQGFAADVVHSIPEARRQLKNANYAAMTLDLALPSGNGMDFARELSDDAELSQLPIVIVSGTEPASWLELEAKSGVVDWIVKPINRQLLVASVAKAAAAYQLNAD